MFDRDDARMFGRYAWRAGLTAPQAYQAATDEGFHVRHLPDVLEGWARERTDDTHGTTA